MESISEIVKLIHRPPAGLSPLEMALRGSSIAMDEVISKLPQLAGYVPAVEIMAAAMPEIAVRPPAGLSALEWAALGLQGATERVARKIKRA